MKTLTKIALAATVAMAAMGANAANNANQAYVGVKIGQVNTDVFNINKKATNYGVYGGYNFNQNFGAEVEFMGSEDKKYSSGTANYEYNAKTYGAYGTYRYNFGDSPVYLKGRLGLAKTDITGKGTSWTGKSDTTNVAGGVGVGFNAGDALSLELGYNHLNTDTTYWGLGANLKF